MRARISVAEGKEWQYLGEYDLERIPNVGERFSKGGNDHYKVVQIHTNIGFNQPSYYSIYAIKANSAEFLEYLQL